MSKLYFFDLDIELLIKSMFKPDVWVIQHFEFFVIRALALISQIELIHRISYSS
jgi:hypothetical protein